MTAEEIAEQAGNLAANLRATLPKYGFAPIPSQHSILALAQYISELAKIVDSFSDFVEDSRD